MQKFNYKVIVVAVCIAALISVFAGCAAPQLKQPELGAGVRAEMISGNCDIEINGDVIKVTGETNFAEGAVLHVSIHSQSGIEIAGENIIKKEDKISHEFVITSDKYDDGVESVVAYITCAPKYYGSQPNDPNDTYNDIYAIYGESFERIQLENESERNSIVYSTEGNIVVFASEMVKLP